MRCVGRGWLRLGHNSFFFSENKDSFILIEESEFLEDFRNILNSVPEVQLKTRNSGQVFSKITGGLSVNFN